MKKIYYIVIITIILISLFIIFRSVKENFTNDSGYFCDPKTCDSLTMSDCFKCSNCSYCLNNFDSKCVVGTPSELLKSGKCEKVYSNDAWTRAVMVGDNDYRASLDLPIMD
jgi:hypothetical protein